MTDDDLLTTSEAGRIIGCSGRTVARLAEKGDIRIARRLDVANGVLLFHRADVERLAAKRNAKASA